MQAATTIALVTTLGIGLLASPTLNADWGEWYKKIERKLPGASSADDVQSLSSNEIVAGLRQALSVGTERATQLLSHRGGFLNDPSVKISMPDSLRKISDGLRLVGQEKLADEFVASMNHAAEKAIPATADILKNSIESMSLEDARGILNGPDDAATEYFRRNNSDQLTDAILPIVRDTTAQAGVTASYKKMTDKLGLLTPFAGSAENLDLDRYIADKTLDGLFLKLADEEKRIREEPLARTTELLKKVFAR